MSISAPGNSNSFENDIDNNDDDNNKCDNSNNEGSNRTKKRWVIHGNFIVPTGNPFLQSSIEQHEQAMKNNDDSNNDVLWLGPGLKILLDHVMTVTIDGIIDCIEPYKIYDNNHINNRNAEYHDETTEQSIHLDLRTEFVCPGLIDLHIHAPQYSYTGTGTDRPLMGSDGWLETYTFPAEERLRKDIELTRQVYSDIVQTTLRHGTTTAVYFGTLHLRPCQILVDTVQQYGQRALIGKVCMDRYSMLASYSQSLEENVNETIELIQYIHHHVGRRERTIAEEQFVSKISSPDVEQHQQCQSVKSLPLVFPLITPRFIPTCTPELLRALGEIAKQYDCHITSHISESIDEVEFTKYIDATEDNVNSTHAGIRSDAEIFDSHHLLSDQCIMAHGIYLNDRDINLLRHRGAAIAHCPLSNFFFAGGTLPCKRLLQNGNLIGLGTDVAGGYNPSIFHSMRMAVIASHSLLHNQTYAKQQRQQTEPNPLTPTGNQEDKQQKLHDQMGQEHPKQDNVYNDDDDNPTIDYRHALYMATLGGAECLGLQQSIGTFAVGMEFDAILLSASSSSNIHIFDTDSISDIFQKICNLGDDRNIKQIFIQGCDVTTKIAP